MNPKIKLLTIIPNATDATSFYRSRGVLPHLSRIVPELEVRETNTINWAEAYASDIVFMQRPYSDDHAHASEIVLNSNRKLWVDYDDDLFSVPIGNPAHQKYSKSGIQKNVAKIIASADVVTVTTKALQKKLLPLNKNTVIIPNAFNNDLINHRPDPTNERNGIVLWRGSGTHDRDLAAFMPQITAVAHNFPKWHFVFLGSVFWQLKDAMPKKNTIFADAVDPIVYWQEISKMKPMIQIVPLHDNDFNHSKSNIAWIEGSYAGAVTLCPNWDQWKNPGAVNYDTDRDFGRFLINMLNDPSGLPQKAKESWDAVCQNYKLSDVNILRANLVRSLAKKVKRFGLLSGQEESLQSSGKEPLQLTGPSQVLDR